MTNLNAAGTDPFILRYLGLKPGAIVHLVRCRVLARPAIDESLNLFSRIEINVFAQNIIIEQFLMAENLAFAGFRQNNELVAHITADGAGIGPHRNGLQSHACVCPQIRDEHFVISNAARFRIEIE